MSTVADGTALGFLNPLIAAVAIAWERTRPVAVLARPACALDGT
jgi:hypothetical protein